MKGFKDSSRTQYTTGSGCGAKGAAKAAQAMSAFKVPVRKARGGKVCKR
jgi:hypothetical protein